MLKSGLKRKLGNRVPRSLSVNAVDLAPVSPLQ
jgi:hypothetical protein